jgi:hypothetical protein
VFYKLTLVRMGLFSFSVVSLLFFFDPSNVVVFCYLSFYIFFFRFFWHFFSISLSLCVYRILITFKRVDALECFVIFQFTCHNIMFGV